MRGIKLALSATILLFSVAAVSISLMIVDRQNALRDVARYNIAWTASQAVNEMLRLEQRLAGFRLGRYDTDEVAMRFDILRSRLDLLRQSDVRLLLASDAEQAAFVTDLETAIGRIEPMLPHLADPGTIEQILERLAPLEPRLGRFAAAANKFSGEQVADDQDELLHLHWLFSSLAGGLIFCGLTLVGLLLWQNRLLGQAHDTLRRMADDLGIAKDAAESASNAKSRFLATMSHELRTPLNAIVGFSELIEQEAFGPVGNPEYRQFAAEIVRSGQHMIELVSDILTMAKLDAGRYELAPTLFDLKPLVEHAITMVRGGDAGRGRDIALVAGSEWPSLRADERAVRQMLLNLLSNAVKFSPSETPVRVGGRQAADGELWLSVVDQGIGMTAEEAALAVQPFQQADSGLSRKYEGTGLGLSIVKAMIERHGGRLIIESERSRGTRVSLVFPSALIELPQLERVA